MATIPVYERRVLPSGVGVTPRAQGAQVASTGQAVANMGRALGQFAEQEMEDRGALEASNALSKGDLQWRDQFTARANEWKPGDPDLREQIGKEFDTWTQETAGKLPTRKAQMYFQQNAISMKNRLDRDAFMHQERTITNSVLQSTDEGMQADIQLVFADPNRREEIVKRRVATIEAVGRIPPDKRREISLKFIEQANMAAEQSELAADPSGYYSRRFGRMAVDGAGASGGFNHSIDMLLKSEGGYVSADGTSGAPANFGINQKFNPDIDVKSLTREKAVEIYKQRYWDKINGDAMPPELQATAMDAAANQGVANANKWIAESGGDPVRFNELRRAHYESLIASGKYTEAEGKSWMRRLGIHEKAANGALPSEDDAVMGTSPGSFMALPYEKRLQLRRAADSAIKQNTAVAAQALRGRLADSSAMARDGIRDPNPLTPESFAPLGADATMAYTEYARTQQLATDVAAFKGSNNSTLEAVASGGVVRAVAGAGYAAEDARDKIRQQAAASILQQRNADPAGYVSKNVPSVTESMRTMLSAKTPEEQAAATQSFARETLAAQTNMGVREPRILSKAAVDDLGTRIASGKESAADLTAALESQYGKQYFPQVMRELMKDSKLPPAMMIIPDLPSADARETVSRLSAMKRSDLDAGVDASMIKDIKAKVTDHIAEFRLSAGPIGKVGAEQMSAYQETMERIAIDFAARGVHKNGGAAADAARQMLIGKYQFDGTLRMPAGVNSGAVTGGLSKTLQTTVLPALTEADVPADTTGARTGTEALIEWRNSVASRHFWLANNDTTAAQLWVKGKNGEFFRVMQGGQQVEVPFESATDMSSLAAQPHNRARIAQRTYRESLAVGSRKIEQQMQQAK